MGDEAYPLSDVLSIALKRIRCGGSSFVGRVYVGHHSIAIIY